MILSATGHRPDKLGGYDEVTALKLALLAQANIKRLQPTKVISGMAQGWDKAVALAAIGLGIPLTAAVPFKGQEVKWPEQAQREYQLLLGRAAEVVIVSPGAYSMAKMMVRNRWMVDNSDQVLALFNGTNGGTANCIAYAEKQKKPVINVWEQWAASQA